MLCWREVKWTCLPVVSDAGASAEDVSVSWLVFGNGRNMRFEALSPELFVARVPVDTDSAFVLTKLLKASFGSDEKSIGIEASTSPRVDACRSVVCVGNANCDCKLFFFRDEPSEVDLALVVWRSARLPGNASTFWFGGDAKIAGVVGFLTSCCADMAPTATAVFGSLGSV